MPCPITGEPKCRCGEAKKHKESLVSPKETLRKLFTDHAVYTKFYIESALQNSPDVKSISSRLLKNQEDIGNYVGTFVGKVKGSRLAKLLKDHIIRATVCIAKLKEKDTTGLNQAVKDLMENAEQVGHFLHSLSPEKLLLKTVTDEFKKHNKYVLNIAVAHSKAKYTEEVKQYDAYYNHMLMFSDMLYSAL